MSLYKNYTLIAKSRSMNFSDDDKLEIERSGLIEDLTGAALGLGIGGAAGVGAAIGAGTVQELRHNRAMKPKALLQADENLYRSILSGNAPENSNIEQLVENLSNSKPKNKADFFRALSNSKNSNIIENFGMLIDSNNRNRGKIAELLADSFSAAFIQKGFANEGELKQALDTLERAAEKICSNHNPNRVVNSSDLLAQIYKRIANNLGNNNTGNRVAEFVKYATSSGDPELRRGAQRFIDNIANPDALNTNTPTRRNQTVASPNSKKAANKFNLEIMNSTGEHAQEFKEHTFKNTRQAREQMETARNDLKTLESQTLENEQRRDAMNKAEKALEDTRSKANNTIGRSTEISKIAETVDYELRYEKDLVRPHYEGEINDFRRALNTISQGHVPTRHNAFGNIPTIIGQNSNTSLARKWQMLLVPNASPEQFKFALNEFEAELDTLYQQGSFPAGEYQVIKSDLNNVNDLYKELENTSRRIETLEAYQNEYNRASQAYTDAQDAFQRAQQAASPEQLEEANRKLEQAEEELRIVSEENSKAIAAYETDPKLLETQRKSREYELTKQQKRLTTINEEINKTDDILKNVESVKNETDLQQKVSKAIDEKLITERKGKIEIGGKAYDITKMDQASLDSLSQKIDQAVDAKIQELSSAKGNLAKQASEAQRKIESAELSLRQTEDTIKRAAELANDPETKKTLQGIADIRNQVRREKSLINSAAHEVGKVPGKIGSTIKAGAHRVGAGKIIAAGALAGAAGAGYYKIKSYLNSTPEGVIDNDLDKGTNSIRWGYRLSDCKSVSNYLRNHVKNGNNPLLSDVEKALTNDLAEWYKTLNLQGIGEFEEATKIRSELQYASLAIQKAGNKAVGMLKLYYKTNVTAKISPEDEEIASELDCLGFDEVRIPIQASDWEAVKNACYKNKNGKRFYSDLQNSKIDWKAINSKNQKDVIKTLLSAARKKDQRCEFLKNCVRPIFNVKQESEYDADWHALSENVKDYNDTVIENPIATFGAPTKLDCTGLFAKKTGRKQMLFTRPFGPSNGVNHEA